MKNLLSLNAKLIGLCGVLFVSLFTSCKEDPLLDDDNVKNDYMVNWIKKFGLLDEEHSWSVVTPILADVNPMAYALDATVYIYTTNPTSGGKLIGKTASCSTLSLDVMVDCSRLFVQVLDNCGHCYENSYYNIIDGRLSITGKRSASRDASSVSLGATTTFAAGTIPEERETKNDSSNPYTLAEAKEKNDKTYLWKKSWQKVTIDEWTHKYAVVFQDIYDNEYPVEFQYSFNLSTAIPGFTAYGGFTAGEVEEIGCNLSMDMNKRLIRSNSPEIIYQRLNGVETTHDKSVMIKDLAPLFGKGSYFEEQRDPSCLERWQSYFNPNVEFTVSGPLTLDFMYGATGNDNIFGYYYWKDGEDPLAAKRYILIDDARPQHNISINTADNYLTSGMQLSSIMLSETNKPEDSADMLVGTSYKVPYFDAGGNPSYDFPANTHVAFFLIVQGLSSQESQWLYATNLSVRSHNLAMGRTFTGYSRSSDSTQGEIDAISFQYGTQYYLGFEDRGGDKDMNDVVFFVTGNAKPAEPYIKIGTGDPDDVESVDPSDPADPEISEDADSWLIACEDLGSTDDYDFNDIVFSVSHVAGSTSAFITPLAAGGILEAQIYYNGNPINGSAENSEIHYLLSGQHFSYPCPMFNTYSTVNTTNAITVELSVPADFSIASNLSNFSIHVNGQESYVISVPDRGTPPQMICLPGDWCWPIERTDITIAYPDFRDWTSNHTSLGWLNNKVQGSIVHR